MLLGAECERHEGLHLTAEQTLLEIVDDEGHPVAPGTEGNVVVTDLYNYGMPFIRYRIGDVGSLDRSACACGRSLPRIRSIVITRVAQ